MALAELAAALADAELKLAQTRADALAALQAGANRLTSAQVASLSARAATGGGRGGIGGGGLFIESHAPLPIGTKLSMEFSLPESRGEWLHAKGVVAWACPKADHYPFNPGMGIRFTDVAPEIRDRILALVKSAPDQNKAA